MINFKQVLAGVAQTGKNSLYLLDVLRGRWQIAAAVALVLFLLFVPFEKIAGGSTAYLHIAFLIMPIAIIAWRIIPRGKKNSPKKQGKPLQQIMIRYACGHSAKMDRGQVEEWAGGSSMGVDQLDLNVSCKQCSAAAKPAKKKKSSKLIKPAIAGAIVLAIAGYGFASGISGSIINQATSLSGSASSIQNFASSGGASDLLSGKGSVEDIPSLKNAIPGGDKLELAGVEAYSFADGYVAIGETNVYRLEVAGTSDEKSRGLSFSEGLQPDQAFLVQNPTSTTVTLVSASFTVDVLWLANNKVVDIAQGVTECNVNSFDQVMQSSGGCVYKPSASADSILYLDGGTVASAGIAEGDLVELTVSSS